MQKLQESALDVLKNLGEHYVHLSNKQAWKLEDHPQAARYSLVVPELKTAYRGVRDATSEITIIYYLNRVTVRLLSGIEQNRIRKLIHRNTQKV